MTPVELATERLSLRVHRVGDFDECYEMWSDPIVTRYIGGRPSTREETWSRVLRYIGHWEALGFGYWVLRERDTGRFVGEAGFADYRRDLQPSIDGVPEIGWALAPWAHGRGLGTEAVRAVVAWGDDVFGDGRTVALIDPENVASIRVAAKCGYHEIARTTYKGQPSLLYERAGRAG